MTAYVVRRIIAVAAAIGLALSPSAVPPTVAATTGCPARPWTLADIVGVPSLWGEVSWPPATSRRVACFGHARIPFLARGGLLNAAFPGVEIAPAFGRTIFLVSHGVTADAGWDLQAWVPPDIGMGPQDIHALDMTNPGLSREGWHDVSWRGSGHFDDPAAAGCRPDDGTSTIDGVPLVLNPAEAVAFCRNEFVIDDLEWLPAPPTDTLASPVPASHPWPPAAAVGTLVLVLIFVLLGEPARLPRRRRERRPQCPGSQVARWLPGAADRSCPRPPNSPRGQHAIRRAGCGHEPGGSGSEPRLPDALLNLRRVKQPRISESGH